MPRKKVGQLPSGNIRKKVYDHSEPVFDADGKPVIDPKTGKQKIRKIYHSVTGASASEVNQAKAEIKLNKNIITQYSDMTLYEAIDKYIDTSNAVLSPPTITGYRKIQKVAFRSIMHIPIGKITTEMLKAAVNEECKRPAENKNGPISSKTVKNEYGLIRAALNTYVPDLNTKVKLPQLEHHQNELSTPDVIYNMVKGTEIELAVMLAMWLSFSSSEIRGLTKSKSISSDGNYITIHDVIVSDEKGNEVIKNKGKQPTRNRTHRIPEYIKTLIDKVETDQLVTLNGPALSERWKRLVKKTGIPHMTFHDLRHVNASVMTLLHIPDKYAQERGGWKTDNIMKSTYMQTFSPERIAVDEKIDNYMQEVMFDNVNLLEKKKYQAWLELFDKKDNQTNKKKFLKFCKENNINI